jgi:hypothetical protein
MFFGKKSNNFSLLRKQHKVLCFGKDLNRSKTSFKLPAVVNNTLIPF